MRIFRALNLSFLRPKKLFSPNSIGVSGNFHLGSQFGPLTIILVWAIFFFMASSAHSQLAEQPTELDSPEAVLRLLIQANAEKDMITLKNYMAQDDDAVGYTIGGRKYVGWDAFEQAMRDEFDSVDSLDIQITDLKVWQRGDIAWFAMELDYGRTVSTHSGQSNTVIPLRDTGVLERRNGKWELVAWHESLQKPFKAAVQLPEIDQKAIKADTSSSTAVDSPPIDLSGEWEIQEEDKSYQATFDSMGNGPYTWQEGTIVTSQISDRLWSGTWAQKGNDREGEFEVLLSENYETAEGVWWYTRVGEHKDIPPREWGGKYILKRLSPPPHPASGP